MAKTSKRRQTQLNKDQAGCMWGLISIFDFRHGRTTRKLLSDRRIVTKDNVASEDPISEVNMITSSEETHVSIEDMKESEKQTLDVVKTSVKELMEEELISEQESTTQTEKSSNISFSDHKTSMKTSDLEALMREVLLVYQNHQGDLDAGRNRTFSIIEEKFGAAVEVFMNENSSGDHKKTERSKDLTDTFQMLSSNKELFLKLLQDQNSLSLNEDQKSESKSMERPSSLENEPSNRKPDVPVTRKHRNFFRKRSKSHDGRISSSTIVILKPNSLENRLKVKNDVHSERIPSHFSFMEIKKRLKNVIGKEQRKPGCSETIEPSIGWSSPNRDHFYTERFAKRVERVSKLRESETKPIEKDENGDVSGHISNIYIEAKKHLSEMLTSGDEDAELMIENLPKTLGKILSFPDNNEQNFVTAQMRLSSCGNVLTDHESQPCLTSSNLDEKPDVLDEIDLDTFVEGTPCCVTEDISLEEAIEIEKPKNQEEMEVLDVFYEQCSSPESIDDEHGEIVEVLDEERSPQCVNLDSPEENEFSSPMESSFANKIDEFGRPSPVSVLEPLFSDNEISPASTNSRPVEAGIQPLCIQFQDQETCTRNHYENEESAFEYVEAVLLASDLNWDEFEKRWLSSVQILDPSLFNEVEIFSSRPSHDQRLLFDSTNEILKDVCDCYLDFFLQLSFIKRKIQPIPKGANLINEIWERIELDLRSNYPLSLDRLVKKDLGISRTWMDLRADSREIVFEIDDSIFEDIMDDTLLSLVEGYVDNET